MYMIISLKLMFLILFVTIYRPAGFVMGALLLVLPMIDFITGSALSKYFLLMLDWMFGFSGMYEYWNT